jgi:cold shock CspA family protein
MSSTSTSETIYQGRVKWFNNKAGYGFITVIDGVSVGDKMGMDIFAHHSAICVSAEQYKYLVQGEYVEFTLSAVEASADYKYQATSIKGMKLVTRLVLLCLLVPAQFSELMIDSPLVLAVRVLVMSRLMDERKDSGLRLRESPPDLLVSHRVPRRSKYYTVSHLKRPL